jgi:hypothetical protein
VTDEALTYGWLDLPARESLLVPGDELDVTADDVSSSEEDSSPSVNSGMVNVPFKLLWRRGRLGGLAHTGLSTVFGGGGGGSKPRVACFSGAQGD